MLAFYLMGILLVLDHIIIGLTLESGDWVKFYLVNIKFFFCYIRMIKYII